MKERLPACVLKPSLIYMNPRLGCKETTTSKMHEVFWSFRYKVLKMLGVGYTQSTCCRKICVTKEVPCLACLWCQVGQSNWIAFGDNVTCNIQDDVKEIRMQVIFTEPDGGIVVMHANVNHTHRKARVVTVPTLTTLEVVVMIISGATGDDKFGIVTNRCFHWRFFQQQHECS